MTDETPNDVSAPETAEVPVDGANPFAAPPPVRVSRAAFPLLPVIFVLITLGLIVYVPSIRAPFVFDDGASIEDNPRIRHLWPLHIPLSAPQDNPLVDRPIVSLSFAINYAISGLDPRDYRIVNIILHLINAVLIMSIIQQTLSRGKLGERFGDAAPWIAAAIAMAWVAHPLNTEAVIYITQRTELMMATFYLLTLWCFIRMVEAPAEDQGRWGRFAFLSCAIGMGCKEVMVSAPIVVLLYDRAFVSGTFKKALSQRRGFYAGLAATWLLLIFLVVTGETRSKSVGYHLDMTAWEYLKMQAGVVLMYFKFIFWPEGLSIVYDPPIPQHWREYVPQGLTVAALAGVSAIGVLRGWKWAVPAAAVFLILAPTSSVLPIVTEPAADRRMYLPLAAILSILFPLGYMGVAALVKNTSRPMAAAAAGLVIVVLTFWSIDRVKDWKTARSIWQDAVEKVPHYYMAHLNLAEEGLRPMGRFDEAEKSLKEALSLRPSSGQIRNALGTLYLQQKKMELAEQYFMQALELLPDSSLVYNNLGIYYKETEQWSKARRMFEVAIELRPEWSAPYYNLADTLVVLGEDELALQRYQECLALGLEGKEPNLHKTIGDLLLKKGQIEQAELHYKESLTYAPDFARPYFQLGLIAGRRNKLEEAEKYFRTAAQKDPEYAEAYCNVGVALVALERYDEAIPFLQRALQLKPDFPLAATGLEKAQTALQPDRPEMVPQPIPPLPPVQPPSAPPNDSPPADSPQP